MRSCRIIFLVSLSALTLATLRTFADRPATEKRGFNAQGAYQVGDLDAVSLFTGTLAVKLPLGQSFAVSDTLSYSLGLVYSSTAGWDHVTCPEGTTMPEPDRNNTGGFAWTISLGKVSRRFFETHWKYDDPAGGRHALYPTLHPGSPSTPQNGVYYTNDSTHVRARYHATGAACESPAGITAECMTLELGSGVVHEFRKVRDEDVTAVEETYRLTRMRDAFTGWVDVTYTDTTWTITDSVGRTQTLTFGGPSGFYNRVNQVRLGAYDGTTAVYALKYEFTSIDRRDFNPLGCSLDNDNRVAVPLLTRLVMPDASYYEMDYYTTSASPEFLSGGLKSLRLATGGEYSWTYEKHSFQSQDPGEDRFDRKVDTVYAVTSKTVSVDGSTASGTWQYFYEKSTDFVPGDVAVPCHRSTRVKDPFGNETRHFFSTSNAKHLWSYGLPLTRCAPGQGYDPTGPFLSSEVYDGTVAEGTKLRSTYVIYESDGHGFVGGGEVNQEKNSRLVYRKTVFHDDSDRYKEVTYSDFTGLGQARVETHGGNLSGQDARTIVTDYEPDGGTLVVDPETGDTTGSTFVLPGIDDPWILGTYTKRTVTVAGDTSTTEVCIDPATGFRSRTRVLAGGSRGSSDRLSVYEPETVNGQSTGRVAVEKLYGGDEQSAMDNVYDSLCEMALPSADPAYQVEHTYSFGSLATSTAVAPCDGTDVLSLVDQTIDANTGLVASRRDPAGVETRYDYDAQGRIISELSDGQAGRFYVYQLPSESQPNRPNLVTVQACPSSATSVCSTADSLTWQRLEYDGLGRLTTERIRIPETTGIAEKTRSTAYDILGRKTSESVWGNSNLVTTFTNYDVFGRVGTVTPPNQPSTQFTYEGVRTKTRRSLVITTADVQEAAYTTETYDAHGRLIRVCEDQDAAWTGTCEDLETTYTYDVGSRLTRVCQNFDGTNCGQIRNFVYDFVGNLRQERHPETGTTNYTHDAKGNVLTKDMVGSTQFDLEYDYDVVGRLIRVEETNGGNPRLLKEFFWARVNSGDDLRAGKLVQTKRHNWVDLVTPLQAANSGVVDAVVTERFEYEDPAGRVSARQTRFSAAGQTFVFDFSQTYDDLGNVATLTYPQCRHSQGGCPAAAPARTVSYGRTKGLLTEVVGFATLTYQSGGMLHQIQHTNGVTYTVEINPADGLERPYRISTTAGWDTGTYGYDGSSNVRRIGQQRFRYDLLNRLVSGQVQVGSSILTQTLTYDVYSNITSLVTNGSTLSTPTDPATNQLAAPLGQYDSAGNTTALDFGTERYEYEYDGVNMMKHLRSNTDLARIFIYNADDERLAQFDCTTGVCETQQATETWTLRGLDNKVLRTYVHPVNEGWQWKDDFVHGDEGLLAVVKPDTSGESISHVHLDHLKTTRQRTDNTGAQAAIHVFYPFGREATDTTLDDLALKFTGHERDSNGSGPKGDIDYMHARYCSPELGRFMATDPKRASIAKIPQSWNKYPYAGNNPLKFIDPDGEDLKIVYDFSDTDFSPRQRIAVARGIAERFKKAGVKRVSTFISRDMKVPKNRTASDRTIFLTYTRKPIGNNLNIMGRRPATTPNKATISLAPAPSQSDKVVNYSINVGAHEGGHASGALPQYNNDGFAVGSILNPKGAEPGSVMEQGVSANTLGEGVLEFSAEDASDLQQSLNPPEEEQE